MKVRPIQGGTRIAGPTKDGTLGLVVNDLDSGKAGFLTAGHVVGEQYTLIGQPDRGNVVGMVNLNTFKPNSSEDIAFAHVSVGVQFALKTIWRPDNTSFQIEIMPTYPDKGQKVKLCGVRQEQEGTVVYENANVEVVEGGVKLQLKGVSLATYPSQPTDSGAPIVSADRKEIEWLGIHGGSVKVDGNWYAWFTPLATINKAVHIYDTD
jgi:hypothetical protein